jgi:hypothetical protein
MRQQLSSNSEDMARHGIPFINASKMKVPPFGVMEVVADPKLWAKGLTPEDENSRFQGWDRIRGSLLYGQLDNRQMLFCAEPSKSCAFMQNPCDIVFNGPSPVEPGAGGKCYRGFPLRAAVASNYTGGDGLNGKSAGISIQAGSFVLVGTNDFRVGAFTMLGQTEQLVKYKIQGTGEEADARVYFVAPNYVQESEAPEAYGQWYVDGIGKSPIIELGGTGVQEVQYGSVFDFSGETLLLRQTGTYHFLLRGSIAQEGNSIRTVRVPYRIGVVPWERRDESRFVREGLNTSFEPMTFYIQNYLKKYLPNYIPEPVTGWWNAYGYYQQGMMEDGYSPLARDETRWERHAFTYFDSIRVTKVPVRLGVLQDLSQSIKTVKGERADQREGGAVKWKVWPATVAMQLVNRSNYRPSLLQLYGFQDGVSTTRGTTSDFPIERVVSTSGTYQKYDAYFSGEQPWTVVP